MFPLESVKYYKTAESAPARVTHAKDGAIQMEIKGEKYPFPALPRGYILLTGVAKVKHIIKTKIFNAAWKELQTEMDKHEFDMLPIRKCAPAVREIDRVLSKMVEMEVTEDMRDRMRLLRNLLVFIMQEDDGYRFRMQYFLSQVKQSKVKLSKADKYYARGKYWKVDYDRTDY